MLLKQFSYTGFSILLLTVAFACKQLSPASDVYPTLDTSRVNQFQVGDLFQLSESETQGVRFQNVFRYQLDSNFIRLKKTYTSEAPSDCAGCKTIYTSVYEVIKPGNTEVLGIRSNWDRLEKEAEIVISDTLSEETEKHLKQLKELYPDQVEYRFRLEIKPK